MDPQAKAAKAKAHMQQRMKSNAQRRKKHDDELRALQNAVDAFDATTRVKTFEELPLSERTQKGGCDHFRDNYLLTPFRPEIFSLH